MSSDKSTPTSTETSADNQTKSIQKPIQKAEWAPISIPRQLKEIIRTIATSEKRPHWSVVEEAVALYYAQKKKPEIKKSLSWLDKIAWYIVKVCTSVGALREVPSRENLGHLNKRINEIIERIEIDTYSAGLLLRVANRYVSRLEGVDVNAILKNEKTDQNIARDEIVRLRGDLNMALKMFVIDLLQASEKIVENVDEEEL